MIKVIKHGNTVNVYKCKKYEAIHTSATTDDYIKR